MKNILHALFASRKLLPIQLALALFPILSCQGCQENTPPPGVVARVNGEDIHLHALQTLMDSRSGSLGTAGGPSLEAMRKNYASALSILIAQTLARQELAKKGINIESVEYDNFRKSLEEDFNADGLDEVLNSASLRKDDWEGLVKNSLAMEIFRNRVLRPQIRIGLDEIKHYYTEHRKEFQLPELYSICFASGASREALEKWCAASDAPGNAENFFTQCLDAAENDLPENFRIAKNLEPGKCASFKEDDERWQTIKFMGKLPAAALKPAQVYAMIENILLAQKESEAFEKWLENSVENSKIQVAPPLNEALAKFALEIGPGHN